MRAKPSPDLGLAVLQVGPLYNNHLARWSAHAAGLGCAVFAAGHVKPGRRPVDLTGLVERIEIAPENVTAAGDAAHVAWLRDVIRRLDPDLIHAHWLPKWGYLVARAADRPFLVTAWGSDLYLASDGRRRRADWAMRNADRVLARSLHMEHEMIARGVPADRIAQVDLGVDLERFSPPSPAERASLREELALPPGPLVLSMRAGIELYNLDIVLEAFAVVREHLPDATLVLVHGDAPLSPRVRALLRGRSGAEGIRLVGSVTHAEMPKYAKLATVAVSVPNSDGSPSSVWEALACGVPMVLSDLPQIDEKVGRSGAVKLVEPRRRAVAAALLEVIEDPARHQRMALSARNWAVANFDQRAQVGHLGSVYAAMAQRAFAPRSRSRAPARRSARGITEAAARPPHPS